MKKLSKPLVLVPIVFVLLFAFIAVCVMAYQAFFVRTHPLNSILISVFIVLFLSIILASIYTLIIRKIYMNQSKTFSESMATASAIAKIGFWEVEGKNYMIHMNPGVLKLLNSDSGDLSVSFDRFLSYLPEEERDHLQAVFFGSIEHHTPYFITHRMVTRDGITKYVEERAEHYYDKNGQYIRSVGSIYDITDRYFSEQRFKTLLDAATDGIHIIDTQGKLVNFSHSFADELGYTVEEMKDLSIFDWNPDITVENLHDIIDLNMNKTKTLESKHIRKDGSLFDVQLSVKGITIEDKSYLYGAQRDISVLKSTEQQLLEKTNELQEINKELEISLESLQETTALYEREKTKYKTILELASDGIFFMDFEGNLIEYSEKAMDLLGYTRTEMKDLRVYDWDQDLSLEAWQDVSQQIGMNPLQFERIHTRKDGTSYVASITANRLDIGEEAYIYASVRDISEVKALMKELDDNRIRWQFAVEGNKDGLWDWYVDTGEVYFSPQWKHMLGFQEEEITNSLEEWEKRVHPDDLERVYQDINAYFSGQTDGYVNEHRVLCKDGNYLWIRDRGYIIETNEDGSPHRMIGTHTDISDYRKTMAYIKEQSYVDELTGLSNRKAYNERLHELMEQYRRYDVSFSMMLIDVDHFKQVNDCFGHSMGDKVLKAIADLLMNSMRINDYVYRIGGEEFVVLLTATTIEEAMKQGERIRSSIWTDLSVSNQEDYKVSVSIGLTQVSQSDDADTLFKRVDDHMYQAKLRGRNCVIAQ